MNLSVLDAKPKESGREVGVEGGTANLPVIECSLLEGVGDLRLS